MDAAQLEEILQRKHVGGFDEVDSIVNGGYEQSASALTALFSDKAPDDLLLLHIVARIARNGSPASLHFLLNDSQSSNPVETAIDVAWLTRQIARCRCKQIIVLVDGSSEGGAAPLVQQASAVSLHTSVPQFPPFGRALIVSEAVEVVAASIPSGANAKSFTSAICDGLSSGQADMDEDGRVTVRDLYAYLKEELLLCTPTQSPLLQTNGAESDDLLIALNPVFTPAAPRVADLPTDLLALMRSDRVDQRLSAVSLLRELTLSGDLTTRNSAVIALYDLREDDSRRVSQAATLAFAPFGDIGGGDSLLGRPLYDAPPRPFQQFVLITHSEVSLSQQSGSWVGGDQAGGDISKQQAGRDIVGASAGTGNVSSGATSSTIVNDLDGFHAALLTLTEEVSASAISVDEKIAALSSLKWFNEHLEDDEEPPGLNEQASNLRTVGGWIWERFIEIVSSPPTIGLAAWVYEFSKSVLGG